MTKEELVQKLKDIKDNYDENEESDHADADELLLEFIDDDEVRWAFNSIRKWYA